MVARKVSPPLIKETRRPTATTPDERENQLIDAAIDLAEQQILSGEASAQVITHFIKLGSSRERLEQQRIKNEVALLETKREIMESEKRTETLMRDALDAMRGYQGLATPETGSEFDDYDD